MLKLVQLCILLCVIVLSQHVPQNKASPANRSATYGDWSRWSICDENCYQKKVRSCLSGECLKNRLIRERKCPGCSTKIGVVKKLLQILGLFDSSENDYEMKDSEENWLMIPDISIENSRSDPDLKLNSFFSDFFSSFNFDWENPFSSTPDGNGIEEEDEIEDVEFVNGPTNTEELFGKDHVCGVTKNERSQGMMAKIIGGKNANRGKWPWQVALFSQEYEKFFCGGTLIAKSWVLTAAHCLTSDFATDLTVFVGLHDTADVEDSPYSIHLIKKRVIHSRYDPDTNDNDIALLRLYDEVKLNDYVGVACLPSYLQVSPDRNVLCKVLGWGGGTHRTILQEADMHIQAIKTCKKHYYGTDNIITSHMLCASSPHYVSDTCGGDSGGPLLCRDPKTPSRPWTLFGITSFGDDCTVSETPGVYTRVSSFRKWIDSVIACDGSC